MIAQKDVESTARHPLTSLKRLKLFQPSLQGLSQYVHRTGQALYGTWRRPSLRTQKETSVQHDIEYKCTRAMELGYVLQ